ncbi:MAG: hypothetical protein K940chlam7_01410 [Chlamydiae bacterium]|nr:hypothetical protein [Chlamydiota bacterium]
MAPKKKNITPPQEEKPGLADLINENPYVQWVVEKRGFIPYVVLAVFALIAITIKFSTGSSAKAESSYVAAENNLTMLYRSAQGEAGDPEREQALNNLKEITNAYPALRSKYDGSIAQLLLIQGDTVQATEFAERCLSRTAQDNLPYYSDFSRTTLLIAEEQYQQALQQAQTLKMTLLEKADQNDIENRNFGDALFAYNLLRIAMLQQKIGTPKEELQAWNEWKQYAGIGKQLQATKSIETEAFTILNDQIAEGSFSLTQYIEEREKHLDNR